jgi:uncharacterized alpha-E superfamily protein
MMLSRVADSLYWMNRYLERGEHTARLLAVKLESMIEQSREEAGFSWMRVGAALSSEKFFAGKPDAFVATQKLAFDRNNSSSLISSLAFARDNARQVREQLSTEVWQYLNRLYLDMSSMSADEIWSHQPARLFRETLETLYTLNGVTYSTLSHSEGWYFLEIGRYIERAQLVIRLLDLHFGAAKSLVSETPKYYDWIVLLKCCNAFEPYCKAYTAVIDPERIAEFLLFDAKFPHSVRYAVDRVCEALSSVAPGAPPSRRAGVERLAGKLKAAIDYTQIEELISGSLSPFLSTITRQCEDIHEAVYASYIAYGAETVL